MDQYKVLVVVGCLVLVQAEYLSPVRKVAETLPSRIRRGKDYPSGGTGNGKMAEFDEWQKQNPGKNWGDYEKWKNGKNSGIKDEDKVEFEQWKIKFGKNDGDAKNFLKWKNRKKFGLNDEDEVEYKKWRLANGKSDDDDDNDKDLEDFKKWKDNKGKKGNDDSTDKDGDVKGTCFTQPTKEMKKRIEQCKCQALKTLPSMIPDKYKAIAMGILGRLPTEPQYTPQGKRKKCKVDGLLSLPFVKEILEMVIRACFWEKMKMVVPDSGGKPELRFDAVKEVMGMFETKPEVLQKVREGIDKCTDSPAPTISPMLEEIAPILEKIMPVSEIQKCQCVGTVFKTYCTDVNPETPKVDLGGIAEMEKLKAAQGGGGASGGKPGKYGRR